VPSKGLTFVADIDDILRVTKIYSPSQGLNNSFVKPFAAWMNMPEIFDGWASSISSAHFHYLTTTPEPATRFYEEFIFANYPLGSFDTRPYNFTTVDQTFSVRNVSLTKLFQSFPERKFVLIADTSNSDVMKDYPQLAKDYPGSVQCILLRLVSTS
jgi:phosphatidate phosphatase APP1